MQLYQPLFIGLWGLQGLILVKTLFTGPIQFGFAQGIAVSVWLAVLIYFFEKRFYPALKLHWMLLVAMCVSVGLLLLFPGKTLESQFLWLPIHFLSGMVAYALLSLAVLHAWILNQHEKQIRQAQETENQLPLLTLERLMFNFVIGSFICLSITLMLGLVFQQEIYGNNRIWHIDHKTLFALLGYLVLSTLLYGRFVLSWRGRKTTRLIYIAGLLLLLSYVGSRFVREVLLAA
jgi:ABC-type uncharacterized transport system permease subunit